MSGVHFDAPQYVHVVWVVAVFAIFAGYLLRRAGGSLEGVVAPPLLSQLLRGVSPKRRAWSLTLLICSALMLTLALMRPQVGLH